ncbi:MAG TPA: GNAT family N-acetyltransferase [Polyangiaceae bacterium]|nr:GNAT family N-acetyltransferase [Polyangiaceae bacterium]
MTDTRLEAEIVTNAPELARREPELWELFERDPSATPFQSPAWLLPWVSCFAPSQELRVLFLWCRARLVFVLPLYLESGAEETVARLVGAAISDYLGALSDPAHHTAAVPRAKEFLAALLDEADRIELTDLKRGAVLEAVVRQMPTAACAPCEPCPRLALRRTLEDHLQQLPFHLRRNLKQSAARLARRGRVEWRNAGRSTLPSLLAAFFELHGARFRARGERGVLADPRVQQFHRLAAPRLLEAGLLSLSGLFLDDRPIAVASVLRRTEAHLYLTGFDPTIEKVSLGSLLILHTLGDAIHAGLAAYDFLRGAEAYKYAWGAEDVYTTRAQFCAMPKRKAALR